MAFDHKIEIREGNFEQRAKMIQLYANIIS